MKIFPLTLFILLSISGFSQSGTYTLVGTPFEALKPNSDGILEFPIYIGTTTFKLKRTNKAVIISDEGEESEEVRKGTWTLEEGIVELEIETDSDVETIQFIIVDYESGVYLKRIDDIRHYKKQ